MANQLGIIHPDLLASVTPTHYPATCTIQQATVTQSDTGAEIPSWANLANHVALPCRIAPQSANEIQQTTGTYAEYLSTCDLAGAYPLIIEKMQAIVATITYDIVGAVVDGSGITTRLTLRRVR